MLDEEALDQEALQQFEKIVVHTDSRYIVDNYQTAKFVWPTTNGCIPHHSSNYPGV